MLSPFILIVVDTVELPLIVPSPFIRTCCSAPSPFILTALTVIAPLSVDALSPFIRTGPFILGAPLALSVFILTYCGGPFMILVAAATNQRGVLQATQAQRRWLPSQMRSKARCPPVGQRPLQPTARGRRGAPRSLEPALYRYLYQPPVALLLTTMEALLDSDIARVASDTSDAATITIELVAGDNEPLVIDVLPDAEIHTIIRAELRKLGGFSPPNSPPTPNLRAPLISVRIAGPWGSSIYKHVLTFGGSPLSAGSSFQEYGVEAPCPGRH